MLWSQKNSRLKSTKKFTSTVTACQRPSQSSVTFGIICKCCLTRCQRGLARSWLLAIEAHSLRRPHARKGVGFSQQPVTQPLGHLSTHKRGTKCLNGERFGLGTSLPLVGQSNASAKEAKESLWLAYNQTGDYGQLEESTRCHG